MHSKGKECQLILKLRVKIVWVDKESDLVFPSYSDSGSRYFYPKGELHNDLSIYA